MTNPTIDSLSPDAIAQKESFLVTFLQEQYPNLDLNEGRVLRDLLIRPAAILHALMQAQINDVQQSQSMAAISANPDLADPALVDAVLSNFKITRFSGAVATGQAGVIIQSLATTTVQSGTQFTFGDLVFTTANAFVGVTTAEAAAIDPSTQRQIFPRSDGTFAFIVDVTAPVAGAQYNIKRNTTFTAVAPAPVGLVSAFAYADFTGGIDAQTNQALVNIFKQALAPQVFSGRIQIDSLLRSVVPSITANSCIGMGDAEMLRDRHNIFSISQGGKADIYSITSPFPVTRVFQLLATLLNADTGLWQVAVGRDVFPGFYQVLAVLPIGAPMDQGSLLLGTTTYGLDLTADGSNFIPDIENIQEGRFTRYQTAVVQFTDTAGLNGTGVIAGATRQYQVFIQGMPNILDLQNKASNRGARNPNADYLIKAAVPALTNISCELQYIGPLAPDISAVPQAIVNVVNSIGFNLGTLPASLIYDAIHNVVGIQGVLVTSPIALSCSILQPDGNTAQLRSGNMLVLPNSPAAGVTSRTTAFMISLGDIDLSLQPMPTLAV